MLAYLHFVLLDLRLEFKFKPYTPKHKHPTVAQMLL